MQVPVRVRETTDARKGIMWCTYVHLTVYVHETSGVRMYIGTFGNLFIKWYNSTHAIYQYKK